MSGLGGGAVNDPEASAALGLGAAPDDKAKIHMDYVDYGTP